VAKRKTFQPQPRLGFAVGDAVLVDNTKGNARNLLACDRDFFPTPGRIVNFLDDAKAPNNGAAGVEITNKHGQKLSSVFINTDELIPCKTTT
jgi:hypothetical protein